MTDYLAKCYDCAEDWCFDTPIAPGTIALCYRDANARVRANTFDKALPRNFGPSQQPELLGHPVAISQRRKLQLADTGTFEPRRRTA